MSTSARWTFVVSALIAVVVVALALQLREPHPSTGPASTTPAPGSPDLAALRRRAALPPCPPDGAGAGPRALQGVSVQCLADGKNVDAARELAGRDVVLNLWAYWCGPCADELPAMADYQRRVGSRLAVITVHQDADAAAALSRLADWKVKLPTWQDGGRRIAAALGVPNVVPTTVVLHADGSVAGILPRPFADVDEIAAAVDETMEAHR